MLRECCEKPMSDRAKHPIAAGRRPSSALELDFGLLLNVRVVGDLVSDEILRIGLLAAVNDEFREMKASNRWPTND